MTSFHVGDWYHWQHCPNTFQVYQFNIKSHEGMGVTGIQMGCNNPDNGIITSHAFSDGGFPTEFFTCSEGYTSVRVRWVPDGGTFFGKFSAFTKHCHHVSIGPGKILAKK